MNMHPVRPGMLDSSWDLHWLYGPSVDKWSNWVRRTIAVDYGNNAAIARLENMRLFGAERKQVI